LPFLITVEVFVDTPLPIPFEPELELED